ncbi:MAG: 50S ribosomal protein L11 methyltransferase [Myxococcota bacterium]|nr:50S ribosomal protein L11 methyltransferase [Myxococcota bacterium]
MARWAEMRLVVPRERVDDVSAVVLELEAVGVQEDYLPGEAPEPRQPWATGPVSPEPARVLLKAWWPESVADGARVAVARAVVAWRGIEAPEWTLVDDQDWAEAWKAGFGRIVISERLAVAPPWEAEAGDLVVEPGMAFGTGEHPTTRACLAAVDRLAVPGGRCLDVGCGTGVLAILAALRGMDARGIDIDPDAVTASQENAGRNQVDVVFDATPLASMEGSFDLVVANVFAEVLVEMAPHLSRLTEGRLVLAGILADRATLVEEALFDMRVVSRLRDGEWVCLEFEA